MGVFELMIECTKPAYDKIINNNELYDKIVNTIEIWRDIFLYRFDSETELKIFNEAEKYFEDISNTNPKLVDVYFDILELEQLVDADDYYLLDKESTMIRYPTLIAYSILGRDILKPQKYGFASRRQLEESVASFCIGEQWYFDYNYGSRYAWRNNNFKNEFSNHPHGDLHLLQIDVSGNYQKYKGLFGFEEEFDAWKDVSYNINSLNTFQNWRDFLMIVLRYAEAIGKGRIPEIVNWREIEKNLGGILPNTAEAFGSDSYDHLQWVADDPIMAEGKDIESMPLSINATISDEKIQHFAYVKDNELFFLKEDKKGDITIFDKGYFKDKKYSVHMEYEESDLTDLLKGVYKLYSRDKSELPRLIDLYLNNPHR